MSISASARLRLTGALLMHSPGERCTDHAAGAQPVHARLRSARQPARASAGGARQPRPRHLRPSAGVDGGHGSADEGRQRLRRRGRGGGDAEPRRAAELRVRRQRLHDGVRQEDRQGAVAQHGRPGADGHQARRDDAGAPRSRHQGRHRPRQRRRVAHRAGTIRHQVGRRRAGHRDWLRGARRADQLEPGVVHPQHP